MTAFLGVVVGTIIVRIGWPTIKDWWRFRGVVLYRCPDCRNTTFSSNNGTVLHNMVETHNKQFHPKE